MKTPITGHTSEANAYMIDDYPYGRTVRCRRRVWLESDPKKGHRFVAQTEHPTRKVWNKPAKSTYRDVAACLYLDEQGHVEWSAVHLYTSANDALAFVKEFGAHCAGLDNLRDWAKQKAVLSKALASGKAVFTINGVRQERTESEKQRDLAEAAAWAEVFQLIGAR